MKDSAKKTLIRKHVRLARKFFLVPANVSIVLYFDDTPTEVGGSAYAQCEPHYAFANLHFDLDQITNEAACIEMAAHETGHVAQMYSDEVFEHALLAVKGNRTKTLHSLFLAGVEMRTTVLTRMYLGSL